MRETFQEYIDNVIKVSETMSVVLEPGLSEDEAIEKIRLNAMELYSLHERNDVILRDNLFRRTPESLTDEDIAELLEFIDKLGRIDYSISYLVNDLIYKAAELRGDRDLLIRTSYNMGCSIYQLRLSHPNVDIDLFADRFAKYFGEAAKYLDDYDNVTDPDTRSYIIRSFANCRLAPEYFNMIDAEEIPQNDMKFRWYENYRALVSKAIQIMIEKRDSGENPEIAWDDYLLALCRSIGTLLATLRNSIMKPEEYSILAGDILNCVKYVYRKDVERQEADGTPIPYDTRYRYNAALYHNGLLSPNALMEELCKIYEEVGPDDFTADGIFANMRVPVYMQYYSESLDDEGIKLYAPTIKRACDNVSEYLMKMPRNEYINELCSELRDTLWYRADTRTTHRREILEYMLICHPPTYIHSELVAWLAEKLFLKLAETSPESLVGVLGVENADAIKSARHRFAKTVYQCGLYHDLGKCMILNHIGNYSRRLTDEEFDVIKAHPKLGAELLQLLGGYDDHAQAALHHHRSYDQKSGYPTDGGDIPRRARAIIDIITVADSLDAGTDNIGRCYAATKSVDTLYAELRQWSGTRYAPYVVKLFDDPEFCESLKEDLIKQRRKVYRDTYTELYDSYGNK